MKVPNNTITQIELKSKSKSQFRAGSKNYTFFTSIHIHKYIQQSTNNLLQTTHKAKTRLSNLEWKSDNALLFF